MVKILNSQKSAYNSPVPIRAVVTKGKKKLEHFSRTRFFTRFENPALFSLLRSREKMAGISNPVKNRVLEIYSYVLFTLGLLIMIISK